MYTTDERITDEIERATGAENTINSRLTNEVNRAVTMETQIIEWLKHKVDAAENLNISIAEDNGVVITVINTDDPEHDEDYKLSAKDNKLSLLKYDPATKQWVEKWSAVLTNGPTQTVTDSIKCFVLTKNKGIINGHALQLSSEYIDDDTYESHSNETSIEIQLRRGNGDYRESRTASLFNIGVHKLNGTIDKLFNEFYVNPNIDLPLIANNQTNVYNKAVTSGDINNVHFLKKDVLVTTGMIPSLVNNDTSIKSAIQSVAGGLVTSILNASTIEIEVVNTVVSDKAAVVHVTLDNNINVGETKLYKYKCSVINGTSSDMGISRVMHMPNITGAKFLIFKIESIRYDHYKDPETDEDTIYKNVYIRYTSPQTSLNFLDRVNAQGYWNGKVYVKASPSGSPDGGYAVNEVGAYVTANFSDLIEQYFDNGTNTKIVSANQAIPTIGNVTKAHATDVYEFNALVYRLA